MNIQQESEEMAKIVEPDRKTYMHLTVTVGLISAMRASGISDPTDYCRDMVRPDAVRLLVGDSLNAQKIPEAMQDIVKGKCVHQYRTNYHMDFHIPVVFNKRLTGYDIIPDPSYRLPRLRFEAYVKGTMVKAYEENLKLPPFGKLTEGEPWGRVYSYDVMMDCSKEILADRKSPNRSLIDELNRKSR